MQLLVTVCQLNTAATETFEKGGLPVRAHMVLNKTHKIMEVLQPHRPWDFSAVALNKWNKWMWMSKGMTIIWCFFFFLNCTKDILFILMSKNIVWLMTHAPIAAAYTFVTFAPVRLLHHIHFPENSASVAQISPWHKKYTSPFYSQQPLCSACPPSSPCKATACVTKCCKIPLEVNCVMKTHAYT